MVMRIKLRTMKQVENAIMDGFEIWQNENRIDDPKRHAYLVSLRGRLPCNKTLQYTARTPEQKRYGFWTAMRALCDGKADVASGSDGGYCEIHRTEVDMVVVCNRSGCHLAMSSANIEQTWRLFLKRKPVELSEEQER